MMTDVALRVAAVSRSYPKDKGRSMLHVLDGVDLTLQQGEFVSLVGPSGCGKTTLLKMVAGLLDCPEGEISLYGEPIRGVPADIGFIFQEAALLPWRSVRENVALGLTAKVATMAPQARANAIDEALALTGLSDFAKAAPYELSGGMQRRVGVARALVGNPRLLFMDEPFVALDALTRGKLQADFAELVARAKTTTLLVTHDVEEAVLLSDRIVVFSPRPGRVLEIVDVDIERPRRLSVMRADKRAQELRVHVLSLIEDYEPALAAG